MVMSLQVEQLEHNMAKLTIEVSAEELEGALQKAYQKQKGRINVPGFRKGKVPFQLIAKEYGVEIFYEDAANILIPDAYAEAMKDTDLEIVSRPEIDVTQLEKGKDFIFTATFALKPEVTLGDYKGIEVPKTRVTVKKDEIEEELKKVQEQNAREITIEDRAVKDGDILTIDYSGSVDGVKFEGGTAEDQTLVIGSGAFIPGFEEQLVGKNLNETADINVTFPEEYHAPDLAGKDAVFTVTVKAIKEKGYTVPTPIQEKAIPAALAKRDILGCAQTGTGKTASFAIPIIQHLQVVSKESVKRQGIKALILTPTRELALQISECIDDYSKYTRVRHGVIFGGVNQRPQVDMLRKGIDILVATPGRLLDLMNQGHIHLDTIQYFVLDEADRMLDMGFIHDIKRILPKLPKEKQTLFFSATMPDTIVTLTKSLLKNPVKIYITPKSSTVDSINQVVYFVEKKEKSQLLISILQKAEDQSVLIFSRTKHNADKIVKILGKAGIGSQAIHGNKSQAARQSALGNFKSGKTRVMVATDIASRGIDISELPMVINYDLPDVPETYVHRIGRTGRAGNTGTALTFLSLIHISEPTRP